VQQDGSGSPQLFGALFAGETQQTLQNACDIAVQGGHRFVEGDAGHCSRCIAADARQGSQGRRCGGKLSGALNEAGGGVKRSGSPVVP